MANINQKHKTKYNLETSKCWHKSIYTHSHKPKHTHTQVIEDNTHTYTH